MPREEGTSLFRRVEPSPEGLKEIILSQWRSSSTTNLPTKFAMVSMKSSIRAITRIVHLKLKGSVSRARTCVGIPYPIMSINFLAAMGMIVPPSDDPAAITPNANDLRFLNHCEMMAGSGPKVIPQANPVKRP